MNQIHAMRVFVRVAETQSFRRAAQQLDVSNALVTRSIAMLEAHLHTRLINRTTRNLSLTEAGLRYLEGCRSAFFIQFPCQMSIESFTPMQRRAASR